jgi:rhodanese-related sulfurtransferase
MRPTIFILSFVLLCLNLNTMAQNKRGYETLVNTLLNSDVDTISSPVLSGKIRNAKLVLLDARARDEYEVSHLQGARHIGYGELDEDVIAALPKDAELVVYCSVGKRSEDVTNLLKERGFADVVNLWGGIFDWTNRGYEVVNNRNEVVNQVHPYNASWGIWINKAEKAYEPR